MLGKVPGKIDARAIGANTAFRKNDALMVGGYDTRKIIGEDSELGERLSKYGPIKLAEDDAAAVWTSARRFKGKSPFQIVAKDLGIYDALYGTKTGKMTDVR